MAEPVAGIAAGRGALTREAWAEAYESLSAADTADLSPADLEGLADAAWWLGRLEESLGVRQKAYAGYSAAGDEVRAGGLAIRLGIEHVLREEPAVGAGWLARAHRHLDDRVEVPEHGFLAVVEGTIARFSGDLDRARTLARHATEIGRRVGDADLIAMAMHTEGVALLAAGELDRGMALVDEAMTAAVTGELSDYYTGVVYCNVLGACLELSDVRRAAEWTEAARAWCESLPPDSPYPGLCRINRAEVASLRGAWSEAEAEAARASEELMRFDPMAAAMACYEAGEIRRRVGDYRGAEEAFERAHEIGFEPQPGLALLRLAQGKAEAAHTALRIAATRDSGSRLRRARLLDARVDVALAVNDLDSARRASDELDAISRGFPAPALDGVAATARGTLRLTEGHVGEALDTLRVAIGIWQELRLPYEAARARMRYGVALRAAGDEDDAVLELRAALSAFRRLGAVPDADATERLLAAPASLPRGLTAREAEVLRLVAAGKTNREIAADLMLSEHTIARHLQNIFAKIGVSSRSGATAFAFEHDLA